MTDRRGYRKLKCLHFECAPGGGASHPPASTGCRVPSDLFRTFRGAPGKQGSDLGRHPPLQLEILLRPPNSRALAAPGPGLPVGKTFGFGPLDR